MGFKITNIYAITALAVTGGALFGFDIASLSAIIGEEGYKCYFNQGKVYSPGVCDGPSSSTQGGITAAMPGGSWLGSLISGVLTDRFGRKRAIQIACILWVIGSILCCAAVNLPMLGVGRAINGLCVGIASAQVPVYVSELSKPERRALLVGTQQWAITWGILIMFYISYGTSFIKNTASFRIPWGLQMIPAILLFVGLMFAPESPRWLARKGRWDEVEQVLTDVHGRGDRNSPYVVSELREIKRYVEIQESAKNVTYLDLLKPRMINRTHIGVFTQIWSQLTGMNVMMYYITYVFAMAGMQGSALLLSSSIQYVINVVMTVPGLLLLDKVGRRPALVGGALFMATFMFANAGILSQDGSPAPPGGVNHQSEVSWQVSGAPAKALIACTYLFVASYAPTWGPVSWIYPPELYPLRERGKAVALATSANWAFNFALGWFVPVAFVNIKWKVYCLFGVFCIAMAIHSFFMFPETAGKTLEEVHDIFEDPNGIKNIGTPAWKTRVTRTGRNGVGRSMSGATETTAVGDDMRGMEKRDASSDEDSPQGARHLAGPKETV